LRRKANHLRAVRRAKAIVAHPAHRPKRERTPPKILWKTRGHPDPLVALCPGCPGRPGLSGRVRACPPGECRAIRGGADSNSRPLECLELGTKLSQSILAPIGVKIGAPPEFARQSGPETSLSPLSALFPSKKEEKIHPKIRRKTHGRPGLSPTTPFRQKFLSFFIGIFLQKAGGNSLLKMPVGARPFPWKVFAKFWSEKVREKRRRFPRSGDRLCSSLLSVRILRKIWPISGQKSIDCQWCQWCQWCQCAEPRFTVRPCSARLSQIVIAAASTVSGLADSPRAQLNLVRLAELAMGRKKLELPRDAQR